MAHADRFAPLSRRTQLDLQTIACAQLVKASHDLAPAHPLRDAIRADYDAAERPRGWDLYCSACYWGAR